LGLSVLVGAIVLVVAAIGLAVLYAAKRAGSSPFFYLDDSSCFDVPHVWFQLPHLHAHYLCGRPRPGLVISELQRHYDRRRHDLRRERLGDPRGPVRHRLRELPDELVPHARHICHSPRPRLYHPEYKARPPIPTNTHACASTGQVEFHFVVNVMAPSSQYNGPLLLVATTQRRQAGERPPTPISGRHQPE